MKDGLAEPRPAYNSRLTKMETDGGSAAAFENEFTVYETCWMDGGSDRMCCLKEEIEGDKDNDPGSLPSILPTPIPRQEAWATHQAPERKTVSRLLVTLTVERGNRCSSTTTASGTENASECPLCEVERQVGLLSWWLSWEIARERGWG